MEGPCTPVEYLVFKRFNELLQSRNKTGRREPRAYPVGRLNGSIRCVRAVPGKKGRLRQMSRSGERIRPLNLLGLASSIPGS